MLVSVGLSLVNTTPTDKHMEGKSYQNSKIHSNLKPIRKSSSSWSFLLQCSLSFLLQWSLGSAIWYNCCILTIQFHDANTIWTQIIKYYILETHIHIRRKLQTIMVSWIPWISRSRKEVSCLKKNKMPDVPDFSTITIIFSMTYGVWIKMIKNDIWCMNKDDKKRHMVISFSSVQIKNWNISVLVLRWRM